MSSVKKSSAKPRSPRSAKQGRLVLNRREALLEVAADLFGSQGYEGTSIRDIASTVGMLPGSVYYHFKSKGDLLLEVHRQGVRHFHKELAASLETAGNDPWERFQAAATAHLTTLLDDSRYAQIVTPEFTRSVPKEMRAEMISERDSYEIHFSELIDNLPLENLTDRRIFRLALFGALNWSVNWYSEGKLSPREIANLICQMFRNSKQSN